MIDRFLNDEKVLNIYMYGSRVYANHSDQSDYDYIIVSSGTEGEKFELTGDNEHFTVYDEKAFLDAIYSHEISVLECLSLPLEKIILNRKQFHLDIDLNVLRQAISSKSSNSWVKAKKKLIIGPDFNPYIAKKSLFHSLRILKFGIQLAKHGKVIDFSEANYIYDQIIIIDSNDWEVLKNKYQIVYNCLKSKFKTEAPLNK